MNAAERGSWYMIGNLADSPERPSLRVAARRRGAVFLGALAIGACGDPQSAPRTLSSGPIDNPPASAQRITSFELDVGLGVALHRLEAVARCTFALPERAGPSPSLGKLRLALHRELGIDSVRCEGQDVSFRPCRPASQPTSAPDGQTPRNIYEVDWSPTLAGDSLEIRYGGRLRQSIEQGEKPGEIHNKAMRAHVGPEGVFLSPDGLWYPTLAETGPEAPADTPLAEFTLRVTEVPGITFVASGDRVDDAAHSDGPAKLRWRSPFPIEGLCLVGGPHQVDRRQAGDVQLETHLKPEHARFAGPLLDAAAAYLRLYEPLIGPYPYQRFTIVESFFSCGFAFPAFTLLSPDVIAMGEKGLRPGYLDHELLHNWWGNGVFVSVRDGNWCEALTSYCANYMRAVLEGHEDRARAHRRDICCALSRLEAGRDKPLCEFGRPGGPGPLIGYRKGSMVFAMLARQIGQDVFWRALRRLADQRRGTSAAWDDLRAVFEQASGQDLAPFFEAWVRRAGLPEIVVDSASYDPPSARVLLTASQSGPRPFDVLLPIRLLYDDGYADEAVRVNRPVQVALFRSLVPPKFVQIDPDYQVLRRLSADQWLPTIAGITPQKPLAILREPDDASGYDDAAAAVRRRYEPDRTDRIRNDVVNGDTTQLMAAGHVLFLGKACLSADAARLFATQQLSFGPGAFTFRGRRHDGPAESVLCCVNNPAHEGATICAYFGNSEAALARAGLIDFYGGDSLLIFDGGEVRQREAFESAPRIAVQIESP